LPTTLPLTHTVSAGADAAPLRHGTTCRIFTGAALPQGADTVVMQEHVERHGERVTFSQSVQPHQHVRQAGEDMRPGDMLVPRGQPIGPGDIGAMAAHGICYVPVIRAPRVAIVPTGDELVEVDVALDGAHIANSNAMMLAAQVREAGGDPWRLAPVRDTPEALAQALAEAAQGADIVLTSGGVSVGDADHLRPVLSHIGVLDFWRIAIKPGKPLAFGHVHGKPLVGLPGNPASSFVCFELFARPMLRALSGDTRPLRARRRAVLTEPMSARGGRRELVRGRLSQRKGGLSVTPLQKQGSGQLSSLLGVDALIDCAANAAEAPAGTEVDVWLLRGENA